MQQEDGSQVNFWLNLFAIGVFIAFVVTVGTYLAKTKDSYKNRTIVDVNATSTPTPDRYNYTF